MTRYKIFNSKSNACLKNQYKIWHVVNFLNEDLSRFIVKISTCDALFFITF